MPQVMVKKNKSSRLANYITDKEEFKDPVKEKWEKVSILKEKLHEVQSKIDKDPTNKELRVEGVKTLKIYKEAIKDEEKLLMQKAKVNWLKEGDKNTAYFHKVLKRRLNRIRILSICAEDGTRFKNCEVTNQFVKHFKGFLGISPVTESLTEDDNVLFEKQISVDEANLMIRDVSDDEIKKDIVKKDFCAVIKDFFTIGKLLGEVNATLICLVPKMLTPQKVSDFRPIACCNVIYKCISKILTNRIKSALNQIVDDNQSAFVPGRAI
ncbi:RNA-directed DNA polymerase, eukaryota, reverse transcriptase zinc-binding domain protein [Tanacetum coccineum]